MEDERALGWVVEVNWIEEGILLAFCIGWSVAWW